MNFLFFILIILVLAGLQSTLPAIAGIHLEFLPAFVASTSLTQPRRPAIVLAVIAGLVHDSLSAGPFGMTGLAFGLVAVFLTGLSDTVDRDLPFIHCGAGAITSAAGSLVALCVVGLTGWALLKLIGLALLSAILTPFIAFALDAGLKERRA